TQIRKVRDPLLPRLPGAKLPIQDVFETSSPWFDRVVGMYLRLRRAFRPFSRINRATFFRLTRFP
ncbi:MAG: hypothetical protein LBP74_08075, partial [Treponema sp.]|nr:hypothetical protein [Treponema sp.]